MTVQAISWVLEHAEAEGLERLVLLTIANHADRVGANASPSLATIMHEARISRSAVIRCISRLEASGELIVQRGRGPSGPNRQRRNLYAIPGVSEHQGKLLVVDGVSETPSLKVEMVSERHHQAVPSPSNRTLKQGGMVSERHSPPSDSPPYNTSDDPAQPPRHSIGENDEVKTARTAIKDALLAACEWDVEHMTTSSWGRVEAAAKELHEAGATVEDLEAFAIFYRRHYGEGIDLTPQAIARGWPAYKAGHLFTGRK